MEKFVQKRKAGEPAPRPKRSKKPASKKLNEEEQARQSVVRADRLALEDAIVSLVKDGTVPLARLAALGLAPAPPPAAPGLKVTETANLTATGGMGLWESLPAVTIISILQSVEAPDIFCLSEVCKGLCALRREPRCWSRLDVGSLKSLTGAGLRRLPTSIPTQRVQALRLFEPSRDSKYSSVDWTTFLKKLACADSLRRLDLGKKFGQGEKMIKSLMPLVKNVEALSVEDLKAKCVNVFLLLLRECPNLRELRFGGTDISWEFFLDRIAQLGAVHRGAGAKSLLRKISHIGWVWGPAFPVSYALSRLPASCPELEELQLKGLHTNCTPLAPGAGAPRLRVLVLKDVQFLPGGQLAMSTTLHGQQPAPQSPDAVTALMHAVERACPVLETLQITRRAEYISKKEQRERGWFFQPAPLLKNIAGIRFPKLRELTLVYIDLDTNSFAGVEMPALERLTFDVDNADGGGLFTKRFPSEYSRKPVVAPLVDSAEQDVVIKWARPKNARWTD